MGAAEHGQAEQNDLVEEHLYLVQHVVHELASRYPRHVDRSEMWSAGAAGLVDASRRYDPATGIPFARYASIRIRGSIIDATRTRDWATRSLRRDLRTMSAEEDAFEVSNGRSASNAELADLLDVSVDEVERRKAASQTATILHLDRPSVDGEDGETESLGARIPETDQERLPADALEQRELIGTIRTAIENLPEIQREVIERYFFGGELLRDIADSFGVTEARASQLRSEAIAAMRAYFATLFDGVDEVEADAPGKRSRAAYLAGLADNSNWLLRLQAADQPVGKRTSA